MAPYFTIYHSPFLVKINLNLYDNHMLAKVNSAAVVGLDGVPVEVEVDIAAQGLPSFTIVGLPDKAVEEAKERVGYLDLSF